MNFFKLFIGDYQRDTAHISMAEHGAYMLMLQHYYATEKPLPSGKALHRMLRAQNKTERDAIDSVSSQFWIETDAGLVNERADEEIKKASTQAATNARIAKEREARRKVERLEHESCLVRDTNDQPNHSHSHSHSHSQTKNPEGGSNTEKVVDSEKPPAPPDAKQIKTPSGEVCAELIKLGISGCNPGHMKLITLLEAGAELVEFTGAAADSIRKNNFAFAYVLGIVEGRRKDAKTLTDSIKHGNLINEKPWYITTDGINKKAIECDPPIVIGRDEHYPQFKQRVFEAYEITLEMERKARQEWEVRA